MGCCTMDADCSDGSACTVDTCTDGLCVADETIAGCCNSGADCDDGDDCTQDLCDGNVCGHKPALCMADGGMGDAGTDDAGMEDAAVPDDASVIPPDDASVIPPDDAGIAEDASSDASDAGSDASTEEHAGGGCGCATKGTAPSRTHFVWLALLAIVALRRRR
jgi:MYXO-CTERM domain-containing protein